MSGNLKFGLLAGRCFFNIPKCKHMHVRREENNTSYVMTPNNEEVPIKKVSSEKDLGVVIDNKLLF